MSFTSLPFAAFLLTLLSEFLIFKNREQRMGWLLAHCERANLPVISMRTWIEQDYAAARVPLFGCPNTLPWSGHPNEKGHALVANTLAEFFNQLAATDNQKSASESEE